MTKFQLRPLKPAKVSEISEATASSPTPLEERVNFHIGNPVEDERLVAFYQNLVLDSLKPSEGLSQFDLQELLEEGVWSKSHVSIIELLCRSVKSSVPYMPRGGFNRKSPGKLAELFAEWLSHRQQEPLKYDLGKESGQREIIFASGGIYESMRVILHTLSDYLVHRPARLLFWRINLPPHLNRFEGLDLSHLPDLEDEAIQAIEGDCLKGEDMPTFLVMGDIPTENFRRQLRHLIQRCPMFFIEIQAVSEHASCC